MRGTKQREETTSEEARPGRRVRRAHRCGPGRGGSGRRSLAQTKLLLAAYDLVVPFDDAHERIDEALDRPVLLIMLSLDGKIYVGDWPIVGSRDVPGQVALPAFKMSFRAEGRVDVVDALETRQRRATPGETERLTNRKVISPVRLENALRALRGDGEWSEDYEELVPGHLAPESGFFD